MARRRTVSGPGRVLQLVSATILAAAAAAAGSSASASARALRQRRGGLALRHDAGAESLAGCPPAQPCECHCHCPEVVYGVPVTTTGLPDIISQFGAPPVLLQGSGGHAALRSSAASAGDAEGSLLEAAAEVRRQEAAMPTTTLPDWRLAACPESPPCNCYCHCREPPGA
mmetsp:Transcript_57766/g.159939  ORF Transcript_57766/g.159939 Transcript_57766/m.159939 type:complete len:170 (-) Transcript_57766:161-670(-)